MPAMFRRGKMQPLPPGAGAQSDWDAIGERIDKVLAVLDAMCEGAPCQYRAIAGSGLWGLDPCGAPSVKLGSVGPVCQVHADALVQETRV